MPINKYYKGHGDEVMSNMTKEYGDKKGKSVFYALANKRHVTPMFQGGVSIPDMPLDDPELAKKRREEEIARMLGGVSLQPPVESQPGMPPVPAMAPPSEPQGPATPPPEPTSDMERMVQSGNQSAPNSPPDMPMGDLERMVQSGNQSAPDVPPEPPQSPTAVKTGENGVQPTPISGAQITGPEEEATPPTPTLGRATGTAMGPLRNQESMTEQELNYARKVLQKTDPKTGAPLQGPDGQPIYKKPNIAQNILGQLMPRFDFHPNLTREYHNLATLKQVADSERQAQIAQATEETRRLTAARLLQKGKGTLEEQILEKKRIATDILGYKPGSPAYEHFVGGTPVATPNPENISAIADAVMAGRESPLLTNFYRQGPEIHAELAKRGYPLAQAQLEYKAMQTHLATMNGPAQERLKEQIQLAQGFLDKADEIYQKWKPMAILNGYKDINRAQMWASEKMPGEMGALAHALKGQIADFNASLAGVYMGGNMPTEASMALAQKNISGDWNERSFETAVELARNSLRMRLNAMLTSTPMGVNPNSVYMPKGAPGAIPETPASPKSAMYKPPAAAPAPITAPEAPAAAAPGAAPAVAPPTAPMPAAPAPGAQAAPIAGGAVKGKDGYWHITTKDSTGVHDTPFADEETANAILQRWRAKGGQ